MKLSKLALVTIGIIQCTYSLQAFNATFTCETSSNGARFNVQDSSVTLARQFVVKNCSADRRTTNEECAANVSCNDNGFYPQFVRCQTDSNGLDFIDESRSTQVARSQAIKHCTDNRQTSNDECMANVFCNDGSSYMAMAVCSTESNGLEFSDRSRDMRVATAHAIKICKDHPKTSNDECDANLICKEETGNVITPVNKMVSCNTTSNGLRFIDESRDIAVARTHVIDQCVKDAKTTNEECRANLFCTDGSFYAPMMICETNSKGLVFSDESRDANLTTQLIVASCKKHASTNNDECQRNVTCRQK